MMLAGHIDSSDLSLGELGTDPVIVVSAFAIESAVVVGKLQVVMDGNGPESGDQAFRPVIYSASGVLKAQGSEVKVANGAGVGWVDLPFDSPVQLEAGTWHLGLLTDGINSAQVATAGPPPTNAFVMVTTYPDGEPTLSITLIAGELGVIMPYAYPWSPPNEDDLYLANLGFNSAQQALRQAQDVRSRKRVVANWHGTFLDDQQQGASLGIVQSDGPLADWVGERVLVTAGRRSVAIYIHRSMNLDLEDETAISISRRAWQALSPLAVDSLTVNAEIIGSLEA